MISTTESELRRQNALLQCLLADMTQQLMQSKVVINRIMDDVEKIELYIQELGLEIYEDFLARFEYNWFAVPDANE